MDEDKNPIDETVETEVDQPVPTPVPTPSDEEEEGEEVPSTGDVDSVDA
jgi:hypothetical protein